MGKKRSRSQQSARSRAPASESNEPLPLRKLSSRGGHSLSLHAAGPFMKAPSPRLLPRPPLRWTSSSGRHAREASGSSSQVDAAAARASPAALQNPEMVVKQLQGNLLYTLLVPEHPHLAGKITGMLLELSADEVAEVLGSSSVRKRLVSEALEVLREAGDPRVVNGSQPESHNELTVDVDAASWRAGSGPMSCTTSIRISPRSSSNPYSSNNVLKSRA